MGDEHVMREPPVLVLTPGKRGWTVACLCGWESEAYDTREQADLVGHDHVRHPPPVERGGFFARRRRGTPTS
jgi:hypothetical protein